MRFMDPVVDMVQHNLGVQHGIPLFGWMLKHERLVDVIYGRIRIFARLDMERFFEQAERVGRPLRWVSAREAGDDAKRLLGRRFPGRPDAVGVRLELAGGVGITIGQAFFGRVFTELASPKDLIGMLIRMPETFSGNEQ